jgi:hypothetical protein
MNEMKKTSKNFSQNSQHMGWNWKHECLKDKKVVTTVPNQLLWSVNPALFKTENTGTVSWVQAVGKQNWLNISV